MIRPMLAAAAFSFAAAATAQETRPNILIITGDDVGIWNVSAYHRGMMGGETPNIDHIAEEGMLFMDHYAQASCTAGRAALITGQHPIRTGLATVGLPGAEQTDFPKDPEVAAMFAQRGVIHSIRNEDGTQSIEDLGNFGSERQKTQDNEVMQESKRFISDAVAADEPFFVWHNTTRMHYRTNLSEDSDGVTGFGLYADGMKELDDDVGELLGLLDELGVADNTMVLFNTDNGPASNSWPDGGNTPFRGEKGVGGYEGGFRIPVAVRWPGVVPPDSVTAEFMALEDWMPTIMAQLGQPDLKEQLLEGLQVGDTTYTVHLDGYDQTPIITGTGPSNRREFFYFTETTFHGLRFADWKFLFKEQDKWFNGVQNDLVTPLITNLKLDPFERFHEARGFDEWQENRSWTLTPAIAMVGQFFGSLQDFPPRQASFDADVDAIMDQMMRGTNQP